MDLYKLLDDLKPRNSRIPAEFPVKLERKANESTLRLDATVKGYFVPRRGRTDFVTSEITVKGSPDMNLRSFFRSELKAVSRYALSVELPRKLGQKIP